MKKLRKIVSLLLAVAMLMSICAVQVWADATEVSCGSGEGTITLSDVTSGETYAVYKMLDLTYASDSNASGGITYSYTIESTSDWYEFFTTGDGADYVVITTTASGINYVTWNEDDYPSSTDSYVETFSQLAIAYATSNDITATGSGDANGEGIVFTGLDLGYYLVTSSMGSIVSLDSTAPSVTIRDKNGKPTITKTVKEDSTGEYGETNTAEIGDTVTFKVTLTGIDDALHLLCMIQWIQV